MTREEAIVLFEKQLTAAQVVLDSGFGSNPGENDSLYRRRKEMAEIALTALRPVSRERVERIWFREPYTRLETKCGENGDIVYSAVNTCMACGHETPIGNFCHNCGAAQTREAVEMVVDNVYFGDSKPAPPSEGNADESALPASQGGEFAELDDDGELPF